MHPEFTRQLGDRPVPSDRRQRHLRLEPRIMFLSCPLHVLLPRYPRVLGAGLHLSQLSHFRGPPQSCREHFARSAGLSARCLPCNGYPTRRCANAAMPVSTRARRATRCVAGWVNRCHRRPTALGRRSFFSLPPLTEEGHSVDGLSETV